MPGDSKNAPEQARASTPGPIISHLTILALTTLCYRRDGLRQGSTSRTPGLTALTRDRLRSCMIKSPRADDGERLSLRSFVLCRDRAADPLPTSAKSSAFGFPSARHLGRLDLKAVRDEAGDLYQRRSRSNRTLRVPEIGGFTSY